MEPISFMRGTIGLGSFVTNTMQSTSSLARLTRYTTLRDTGLRTSTLPARRRFISHSEWKAGMSVRRLAQMIMPDEHRHRINPSRRIAPAKSLDLD